MHQHAAATAPATKEVVVWYGLDRIQIEALARACDHHRRLYFERLLDPQPGFDSTPKEIDSGIVSISDGVSIVGLGVVMMRVPTSRVCQAHTTAPVREADVYHRLRRYFEQNKLPEQEFGTYSTGVI